MSESTHLKSAPIGCRTASATQREPILFLFENLKNIKVPVLITDGRSDEIDPPKNSLLIANQILFAWLAFFECGHSFLYTSPKHFADTVNLFLE